MVSGMQEMEPKIEPKRLQRITKLRNKLWIITTLWFIVKFMIKLQYIICLSDLNNLSNTIQGSESTETKSQITKCHIQSMFWRDLPVIFYDFIIF